MMRITLTLTSTGRPGSYKPQPASSNPRSSLSRCRIQVAPQ
jgi:hypothetical protein